MQHGNLTLKKQESRALPTELPPPPPPPVYVGNVRPALEYGMAKFNLNRLTKV